MFDLAIFYNLLCLAFFWSQYLDTTFVLCLWIWPDCVSKKREMLIHETKSTKHLYFRWLGEFSELCKSVLYCDVTTTKIKLQISPNNVAFWAPYVLSWKTIWVGLYQKNVEI